jgi:putative redox protein
VNKVMARRREGFAHEASVRQHSIVVDEPPEAGGSDSGSSPTELLALSLASCTAITVEKYAGRKGWDLGAVAVEVGYEFAAPGRGRYEVVVKVPGELDREQLERLREIAGKCPVHRALTGEIEISDRVERLPEGPPRT